MPGIIKSVQHRRQALRSYAKVDLKPKAWLSMKLLKTLMKILLSFEITPAQQVISVAITLLKNTPSTFQ